MWEVVKKYWDIIGGFIAGFILALMARFELARVQLFYSIIILVLVSIGVLRMVKQAIETHKDRKHSLIDNIVDGQGAVKAVRIAQEPMREGEKIGKILIEILEGIKNIMKKIKAFLDKFKGFVLTVALMILAVLEMCGGFINDWCGGVFTINGIEVLPVVALVSTAVVGIISDGYTKEQRDKIKALFSKSSTNELVKAEIKRTISDKNTELANAKKDLAKKQTELGNLQAELERNKNTHAAKKEMYGMVPQLATADDVQTAANDVVNTEAAIANKTAEIDKVTAQIDTLETTINALKNQL